MSCGVWRGLLAPGTAWYECTQLCSALCSSVVDSTFLPFSALLFCHGYVVAVV